MEWALDTLRKTLQGASWGAFHYVERSGHTVERPGKALQTSLRKVSIIGGIPRYHLPSHTSNRPLSDPMIIDHRLTA